MNEIWGSWELTHTIRRRGPIDVYGALRGHDGKPHVLLRPNPATRQDDAAVALESIGRAHRHRISPHVAQTAETGVVDGEPFVALDTTATVDLESVLAVLADTGVQIPHGAAIIVTDALLNAFSDLHDFIATTKTCDVTTFGAISYSNFLMGADGTIVLVGLGYNFPTRTVHGFPAMAPGLARAPELLSRAASDPSSDVHVLFHLFRSLMPFADLPHALTHGLIADEAADPQVTRGLRELQRGALEAVPGERALDMAGLKALMRGLRRYHGGTPDHAAYRRHVCDVIAEITEQQRADFVPTTAPVLKLTADARTVSLGDAGPIDLSRRGPLRRVLLALVEARRRGSPQLDWSELLEAGWPGEKVDSESGRGRVYVAVYSLRKLGLQDIVIRHDDGYTIHPRIEVTITP